MVIEMSSEKNTSKKASSWKIPLFKMYWDNEDVSKVNDAITCGVNWAIGKYTTEFEEKIHYTGIFDILNTCFFVEIAHQKLHFYYLSTFSTGFST